MKHVFERWLKSFDRDRLQRPAMYAAGLALAVGTVGGPAAVQAMNDGPGAGPSGVVTATVADSGAAGVPAAGKKAEVKKAPGAAQPKFSYQEQSTYYFCAPAATRIALSATGHEVSQQSLAQSLGTTENGTDSAYETTRVLNKVNGDGFYRTREIAGPAAKPAEMDRLQADTVRALSSGRPIVANIKGTAVDVDGKAHSYEGGHYLTVVGYRDQGRTVKIADPYDTSNGGTYWMSTISLAHWIAERGYSG